MPLVRISMVTGRTYEERQVIGSCVHEALVEAIGIPADDLFQVVTEYGYEESATDEAPKLNMFWDPHSWGWKDDSILFVQVFLRMDGRREQSRPSSTHALGVLPLRMTNCLRSDGVCSLTGVADTAGPSTSRLALRSG